MSVEIIPVVDHEQYTVDGFLVYKTYFGNWSCKTDLSQKQLAAFEIYEEKVINNKMIKKHTKATYKG